ncbi:MAG: hypothetical protein R3A80_01260 [Bdellovibrionota bacterium]
MASVFLFKAQNSVSFPVVCFAFTLGAYHLALTMGLKHPEFMLYAGSAFSLLSFLNYYFFEFYVTYSGITFCSYKTLFSRKYIKILDVGAYSFERKRSGGKVVEVNAEIYDKNRVLFSSFVVGKQDTEFVEVMQKLQIPLLDAPILKKRESSPY